MYLTQFKYSRAFNKHIVNLAILILVVQKRCSFSFLNTKTIVKFIKKAAAIQAKYTSAEMDLSASYKGLYTSINYTTTQKETKFSNLLTHLFVCTCLSQREETPWSTSVLRLASLSCLLYHNAIHTKSIQKKIQRRKYLKVY